MPDTKQTQTALLEMLNNMDPGEGFRVDYWQARDANTERDRHISDLAANEKVERIKRKAAWGSIATLLGLTAITSGGISAAAANTTFLVWVGATVGAASAIAGTVIGGLVAAGPVILAIRGIVQGDKWRTAVKVGIGLLLAAAVIGITVASGGTVLAGVAAAGFAFAAGYGIGHLVTVHHAKKRAHNMIKEQRDAAVEGDPLKGMSDQDINNLKVKRMVLKGGAEDKEALSRLKTKINRIIFDTANMTDGEVSQRLREKCVLFEVRDPVTKKVSFCAMTYEQIAHSTTLGTPNAPESKTRFGANSEMVREEKNAYTTKCQGLTELRAELAKWKESGIEIAGKNADAAAVKLGYVTVEHSASTSTNVTETIGELAKRAESRKNVADVLRDKPTPPMPNEALPKTPGQPKSLSGIEMTAHNKL